MMMSASGTAAVAVSTSPTRAPGTSASSSSRTRVDTRTQHLQLGGAALGAHEGPFVGPVPPQQVLARGAHQEPEPSPPVEHAHREAASMMQRGRERLRQEARPGRLLAPVDHLDARPASGPTSAAGRATPPGPAVITASTVGTGEHTANAHRRASRVRATRRGRARSVSAPPAGPRRRRRRRRRRARSGTGASAAIRPPTTMQSPLPRRAQLWVRCGVGLERVHHRDRPPEVDAGTPRAPATGPRRRRTRSSNPTRHTAPRPGPAGRAGAAGG